MYCEKKIKKKEVAMMRGSLPYEQRGLGTRLHKGKQFFSCRIFGDFSRPKCFVNFLEWNIVYREPPKLFDHRTYFL